MTNMLWQYVDPLQLLILVHGARPPTDAEWEDYSEKLFREYHRGRLRRILVLCDGPGPTPAQRKKLHHTIKKEDHPLQTAVINATIVHRTIVTALSWFHEIRAFSKKEIDVAFRYLALPEIEWYMVKRIVATLRMHLDAPTQPSLLSPEMDPISKLDELMHERLPKLLERLARK